MIKPLKPCLKYSHKNVMYGVIVVLLIWELAKEWATVSN